MLEESSPTGFSVWRWLHHFANSLSSKSLSFRQVFCLYSEYSHISTYHKLPLSTIKACFVMGRIWFNILPAVIGASLTPVTYPERFHTAIRVWEPKFWRPKKETFIYSDIFYSRLCVFLLNLSRVYHQVREHTLPLINHPEA